MILAAEQAAPGWLPYALLAIPVAIMLLVGVPALRKRSRAAAARRSQESRRPEAATEIGSASDIADPSSYSSAALLKALAVRSEDHGPKGGLPHNEGWAGTMLGLKSRISTATQFLEPHVFWGTRAGRQLLIRLGPDENLEGGTVMFSNRHVRHITVLRVGAPLFRIESDGGALRASDDSPPDIRGLIGSLTPDLTGIGPAWKVPYGLGRSLTPTGA